MARLQPITRIVNALDAQQRLIIWLACSHKVSVSALMVSVQPRGFLEELLAAAQWTCPFCPDAPPPDPSSQERYKRAGEPDVSWNL